MPRYKVTLPEMVSTAYIPPSTRMVSEDKNRGIRNLWKGYIATSQNIMVHAYIKQVKDDNELYRETLCSLLARAMGISSPEPVLVKVDPLHPTIPSSGDQLFFGTIDCNAQSFARFLHETGTPNDELLLNYADLHKIICLDELVANPDRHHANILYDGANFHFIDHGLAFPPDMQSHYPMSLCDWGTNQLADLVNGHQSHNDVKTKNFIDKVEKFIRTRLSDQQINALPVACNIFSDPLDSYHSNIQTFLLKRLPLLAQLVGFGVCSSDEDGQLNLVS